MHVEMCSPPLTVPGFNKEKKERKKKKKEEERMCARIRYNARLAYAL